jgi:hypothetical protein
MTRKPEGSVRRKLDVGRKVLGALLVIAGTVLATGPALSAADGGCGEYSYGFTGTRLINDGISTSAGPFVIDLPAGTYDITMLSDDNHPSATYQTEQTQEQWYFVLDNGYQSPPTNDVPNDRQEVVTNLGEVELSAATAITVEHLREGGLNSVNVECVGFTPSAVATVLAPATTTTTEVPAIAAPATVATAAVESTTTTIDAAVVPASTVQTKVKGVVIEAPIQQLAVTGRGSDAVVLTGILLIVLGLAMVSATARTSRP